MFSSGKSGSVLMLFIAASLASFAQGGPQSRIPQAVDRNQRAVVRGSAHPIAKPEFDAGRVDGSMKINGVSLVFKLSPSQQAALRRRSPSSQNAPPRITTNGRLPSNTPSPLAIAPQTTPK